MKTHTKLITTIGRACLLLAGLSLFAAPASAQSGSGSVEGRVLNAGNGSYLGNARVTVQGTNLEALTNSFGDFRLDGVPAGDAKITVFYTGLASQTSTVKVTAGGSTHQDFSLSTGSNGDTVMLDPLTVASKRDTDAAAIAINEQRFAPNIKNVVSTDAFGDIAEGNVGDFVKFLPGVTIDYVSPDARTVSIRGVAANYTALMQDGFLVASANSSTAGRTIELEQISLNNASRIEVTKSRTPDFPASALGGAVNLISRSAFERTKASLNYRAFLSANGDEKEVSKTRAPGSEPSHKIKPGFDLTYVNPVSKNFGYTVNLLESDIFYPQHRSAPGWAPGQGAQVGSTVEIPVMRNYQVQDGPKNNQRESVGTTLDWRFTPTDVLSASFQWSYYNSFFGNRPVTYTIGNSQPSSYDSTNGTFVHGANGAGSVALGGTSFRHKYGYTYQPTVRWQHNGPIWTMDGGVSFSHATNHYHDYQDSHFENVTLSLRGNPTATTTGAATVWFDGIDQGSYLMPASIKVFNNTGTTPIDLSNPANYNITSAGYNPADSADQFKTLRFSAKRELNLRFPFAIRTGAQVQEQTRDIRKDNPGSLTFVGPDHTANTADDNASLYNVTDPQYANGQFLFGTPQVPYPSPYVLYKLYKDHPDYFTPAAQATAIANLTNNSMYFKERITAAFLTGDLRLVDNRLRVVGGVRFERTDDEAAGPLNNPNAAKGITDTTQAALARYGIRQSKIARHYGAGYPSLDAQFNVTSSVIARAAYARSIGRPDLNNLIPTTTLPDTGTPGLITFNTGAIAPTQVQAYDVSLEYYFAKTGVFSVGAFKKDFTNFVGTTPAHAPTIDELAALGVPSPELYVNLPGFTVAEKTNVGDAGLTGVEFNYSQVLDFGFLPDYIRGHTTIFANAQKMHLEGSTLADFSNFIRESGSWGVKFAQQRYSLQANFNYRGRQRMGAQAFAPGAYDYFKPRVYLDANGEYRFTKNFSVFINARNLTNVAQDIQRYAATTPSWARTYRREEFGVQYTVGVKGTF